MKTDMLLQLRSKKMYIRKLAKTLESWQTRPIETTGKSSHKDSCLSNVAKLDTHPPTHTYPAFAIGRLTVMVEVVAPPSGCITVETVGGAAIVVCWASLLYVPRPTIVLAATETK